MIDGIFKGLGEITKGASSIIDKVVTNDNERAEAKNQFAQLMNSQNAAIQKEVTDRHASDMASDSWLSKNIRPMTLIFILGLYSMFALTDGNIGEFNVNDGYVNLLGEWGRMIMIFYFGGRTVEKSMDLIGKYNIKSKRERIIEAKADLERSKKE